MKMVCFSHAGGMSYYYAFLQNADLYGVDDVILYEYPLRATRSKEPHYKDFKTCVETISDELRNRIVGEEEYILFGHSFGAFVAYESAMVMKERYRHPPGLVIISGQKPPCVVDPEHYRLCEEEGVEFLKKLGGLPENLWDYPEALNYFTELCRADLRVLQTYAPSKEYPETRLPNGLVMYGSDDVEFSPKDLVYWKGYFEKLHEIKEFNGNHFYLNPLKKEVLQYLNESLIKILNCENPMTGGNFNEQ